MEYTARVIQFILLALTLLHGFVAFKQGQADLSGIHYCERVLDSATSIIKLLYLIVSVSLSES